MGRAMILDFANHVHDSLDKLNPAKASFVYELRSINLTTLPPNEQAAVLDRFTSFLDSLSEPIAFWVVEDEREVDALGSSYKLRYKRFFIESSSQIDNLISNLGTKMVRVLSVPKLSVMYDGPKYVVDENSQFVQTYNVTNVNKPLSSAKSRSISLSSRAIKRRLDSIPSKSRIGKMSG